MPDYPVERAIRTIPGAAMSLLRRATHVDDYATADQADRDARNRNAPTVHATSTLGRFSERVLGAMGLGQLPDETFPQFQDAVYGPTEQWFPTRALAARARGVAPAHDVNLPDPHTNDPTDPRWRAFAMDAMRRR